MSQAKIGIIGGSGLYKMEALKDVEEVQVETSFRSPSDALIVGTLDDANELAKVYILLAQPDDSGMTYTGFWLLRQ